MLILLVLMAVLVGSVEVLVDLVVDGAGGWCWCRTWYARRMLRSAAESV